MKKFSVVLLLIVLLVAGGGIYYLASASDAQVTFYVDTTEYHTVRVERNAKTVPLPKAPSKDGYVFDGWYFDKDAWKEAYTDTYFADSTKLPNKISLYAKFIPDCKHTEGVSEWEVEIPATCKQEGEKVQKCLTCGAVLNTVKIEKAPHSYTGTLDYVLVGGQKKFTFTAGCANGCGFSETLSNVSVESQTVKKATCLENGTSKYTYVYENKTYVCEKKDIPATGHMLNGVAHLDILQNGGFTTDMEGVFLSASTETPECETECDAYYVCSECSQVIKMIAMKSHVGTWKQTKAPSCIEEGEETLELCLDCLQPATRPIAMLDHAYVWELTAKADYTVFTLVGTCKTPNCGDDASLPNVTVKTDFDLAPTCLNAGKTVYSYDYKGETYSLTRVYEPTRLHKIGGVDIADCMDENGRFSLAIDGVYFFGYASELDCMETAKGYYVCSACEHNISADVYKPHSWLAWEEITPSTCIVEGDQKRECADCDAIDEGKIPVTSHPFAYALHYDAADDTFYLIGQCQTEGCNAIDDTKKDVAVTHKALPDSGEIEYTYKDSAIECKLRMDADDAKHHACGDYTFHQILDENGKLDYTKWGHLDNVLIFNLEVPSECMREYAGALVCDECQVHYSVTLYRGHDFSTWTTTKEPTCDEVGREKSTCAYENCSEISERDIEMLPHNFIYTLNQGAEHASIDGECADCGATTQIEEILTEETILTPTCVEAGKAKCTYEKNGVTYFVYVALAMEEEAHCIGGKDASKFQNPDGSFNSTVDGIHILEGETGTVCDGGYVCSECHRFVEVTVKVK